MIGHYISNNPDGSNGTPKILVVDDLKENHRAFNRILQDLDAKIYSANSGEDAISLTLRHHFAVILLDVMMPGMDGYETANIIRVNDDTKLTPIIFITAMDKDEDYESKGYEAGAVDYLFKPVKPNTLTGKVKIFIELEKQRSKIKQTLSDIQRLEHRNELLLKSVGEGILGLDQTGSISFSNPAAQAMLGHEESELEKMGIMDIVCTSTTDKYSVNWKDSEIYNRCIRGIGYHESIGVFWKSDRNPFPVEYIATPIREMPNDQFIGVVIAFQDVTERKKTEDQLARLAQMDTLTGLYNRYSFSKQLHQSLARSLRQERPLALLFIDLDKFKQVNDNLGHEAGDILLKETAIRLQHCVRDGDVLSRIGGDEFSAILESISSGIKAAQVAKKIIHELSQPFTVFGNEVYISASIGIATCPESASNADTLLRCADMAMYKAKQSGRNAYQFFTEVMQEEVSSELVLENALRSAVLNHEFYLHYQPKVDPISEEVLGVEALIRWNNAKGENIPPSYFIPKAEEMGLIHPIGKWVLEHGCTQMRLWQDEGRLTQEHTISINLSMRQLMSKNLLKIIKETLKSTKLKPSCLELEVTESMMMEDPESTISILRAIHSLGVKIAIDDFGTGYSSLSYLRQLPFDTIKIDQSFVQVLGEPNGDAIVKTIINLGNNLGLKIVAEGAETAFQVDFLSRHKVDMIQGFYFSKPLSSDDFIKFISRKEPKRS